MTKNPILAANPAISAIVKASAGVGKTYLLVTRLLRLLLTGIRPDAILAITFTRKASAEMQSRLFERLYQLAIASDTEICAELKNIGVDANPAMIQTARQLYEKLMLSEYQVRTSTFHAFCQDVLRKFPLEADVPPGFDLLDDEASYRVSAWDALYDDATQNTQSQTAQALETLYELSHGLHNTHQSLDSFLNQRSDWWAYTQGQASPITFAIDHLRNELDINPEENPYQKFFSESNRTKLSHLVQLLSLHDTKTNVKNAAKIQHIIEADVFSTHETPHYEKHFNTLLAFFLNASGENRHQKSVKSREKKLGEQGENAFLEICLSFTVSLIAFNEERLKHHLYHLSAAWYTAGQRLIHLYQKLKQEQRLLDFVDLEWKTYQLLNHSDNALWVQYKLDQRIDHLLIDEFQDTNPTQWRLILPLLEEFSYAHDKSRSVFIVGDEKQSIYSFRRADPRLLSQAGDWIESNLEAQTFPMDKSRRSSPAIMALLNALFQAPFFEQRLPNFHEHSTFLNDMPGQITRLPLIEKVDIEEQETHFRNPLETALLSEDQPYYREGQQIATHIAQLIHEKRAIETDDGPRPVKYSDIMLLIRSRIHVADYEQAFREANLPYLSNNKGTLFECQEIQDLIALMDALYTPHNNLAFAAVLRSPIFHCSNDDLITIASHKNTLPWFQAAEQLSEKNQCSDTLQQAVKTLKQWRALSGHLPIHDLLDLIFHQSNIFYQYDKQIPEHFKQRVRANLNQFLSMALETESGRYPSLGRFVGKLRSMRQNDDSPDEASNPSNNGAIRILTIHASKGLEAPIVFLADTASVKQSTKNSHQALVQWPENKNRPAHFLLCPVKNKQPEHVKNILESSEKKANIEDANLLYVALTRARQALYISGCRPAKSSKPSWYSLLESHWPESENTLAVSLESQKINIQETQKKQTLDLGALLFDKPNTDTNPSIKEEKTEDDTAALRGTMIHRALELVEKNDKQEIEIQIKEEFLNKAEEHLIQSSIQEAISVFSHPAFQTFFNPKMYHQSHTEMPILLNISGKNKTGIIDRVIVNEDNIIIIDYKTHRNIDSRLLQDITKGYRQQMFFYQKIAQGLWPKKHIRLIVLFTHYLQSVELS